MLSAARTLPLRASSLTAPSVRITRCTRLSRSFASTAHRFDMKIHPVPVRDDNYAYILQSSTTGHALFVDPFDVPTVRKAAESLGIKDDQVVGLLTTHHHADHSGGNETFASQFPGRPVYGGSSKIPALTKQVKDGDQLNDALEGVNITCVSTPCHTQDHICYLVEDTESPSKGVFTGDTLFISGCGRFFEGTAEEMLTALTKLSKLPEETIVYCGHEYTASNVAFSAAILPSDEKPISQLVDDLKHKRNNGRTTGVYSIAQEKSHNPFMRCNDPIVKDKAQQLFGQNLDSPTDVMHALRELKNAGKVKANI
ncbi:hydroxyacylglutathione hydrolase [Testicularia cyperi]|uniref:hydroxyacylglutathione hydrolase n=1 Tax=Testicularia cyperi TaxID=1882483 RepID=A0A317XU71_9BASI|nr:hydroxyacylglutathione hydrolase [Testicularia cyperi]